ncbi:MAG: hypothetical protein JWR09_4920 [Mucilaginibacter sp.]|nr:hypothetical protein [Mucilaginibacter sp.]
MLLPVHQPCIFLKYHGCSNCRKYTQKRLFNLAPVKHENYRKQYCSIITLISKFMYESEIRGQRSEIR